MTDGPAVLPAATAEEVSGALLSPQTYDLETAKACVPTYGVQFSFFRDAERIDVLLCFECDTFGVGRDGRSVGGEDFDDSRAVLVRAAKQAFPDDAVIQQLGEGLPSG